VPPLADLQRRVRNALVLGDVSGLEPVLVGGRGARSRLAIHQRHYRTSLITALLERFPATVWLAGSPFVIEAAREFVRECPPSRPCMAEYGEEFPAFLITRPGSATIPYLQQFAGLEWQVGRVSLAVDMRALRMDDVSVTATLEDARVTLQPGVHYLHADWGIDELMSLYLSDSSPEQFLLQSGDVWLELRGLRGQLEMNRLSHGDFAFRAALASGESLADAAFLALDSDAAFDAGRALLTLVRDELVIGIDARRVDVPHE
jgi:hypothetical protein